jgi:hypothetical protein
MKSRIFSVDEANQTIPLVSRIAEDIIRDYRGLRERSERYRELRAEQVRDEGLEERLNHLKREMGALQDQIDDFVRELAEIGCEMKDLELGLVDFPAEMDGRRVFLCWQPGEERIEYWHEVTDGYRGRQPLPVTVL